MWRDGHCLLLTGILESSNDAIIGKDLDGVITAWNPAAETIYGYQEAEAMGKPISIIVPEALQHEIPLFLKKIKRAEQVGHNPGVKVIISSGMASEGSETEAVKLGARRFVEKPHQMKTLLKVVREVLDGH